MMFIFTWFGVDLGSDLLSSAGIDTAPTPGRHSASSTSSCSSTILVAIGGAVITANAQSVNTPVAISAITAGSESSRVLLILYRIIDPPGSDDARRLRHRDQPRDRRIPRADRRRRHRLRRLARDAGGGTSFGDQGRVLVGGARLARPPEPDPAS